MDVISRVFYFSPADALATSVSARELRGVWVLLLVCVGIGERGVEEVRRERVQTAQKTQRERETPQRNPRRARESGRKKEIGEIDKIRGHVARKGPTRLDSPRWKSWLARASTVACFHETRGILRMSDLWSCGGTRRKERERKRYHLPLLTRCVNMKNQCARQKGCRS